MNRATILCLVFFPAFGVRLTFDLSRPQVEPVTIRVPLEAFQRAALGASWREESFELEEETLEISRVADYLQRRYEREGEFFWFYVGYVDRWDPAAIHHPKICFPATGLELAETQVVPLEIPALDGPQRFHELRWRDPLGRDTLTLFTFYYNGKLEPNEKAMRAERVLGVRYFAIITLSGPVIGSLEEARESHRDAISKLVPILLDHLPDGDTLLATGYGEPGSAPGESPRATDSTTADGGSGSR